MMPVVSRAVDTDCDARGTFDISGTRRQARSHGFRVVGRSGTMCASVLPIGNCVWRVI